MSMSSSVCGAAHTLLSPEPKRLSLLLPGDRLRVRENDESFQGSWRFLEDDDVGRGRGANSRVVGLSSVGTRLSLCWGAAAGGGRGGGGARVRGLRRGTGGNRLDGSGKWGIFKVSRGPV